MTEPQKPAPPVTPPPADLSKLETKQETEKEKENLQSQQFPKVELSPEDKQKAELLVKIGEIVKDYGGLEANIPPSHEYWDLVNQFRSKKY